MTPNPPDDEENEQKMSQKALTIQSLDLGLEPSSQEKDNDRPTSDLHV